MAKKRFGAKTDRLSFRCTPDEKRLAEAAAWGTETELSDWLRSVVVAAARAQLGDAAADEVLNSDEDE